MMNNANGWMGGWMGGGMWLWTVIGVAVVVLLAVVIGKMARK
jgi:anti-sigma-K factor RskA